MLLLHITSALVSLGVVALSLLAPSRRKVHLSYGLMALTLATGTYLVVSTGSALLPACTSGLVYLVVAMTGTYIARARLISRARQ